MDDKNLTNQSLHNKLGQLIGHFVDFQKTLESQNQKQRALGEILVELTTQFEKDRSFSREPQNETQTFGPVQKAKLSDSGQVLLPPMYSISGLSDIIKEVRIRLIGLDQKTDLIQNNLFGICDDVSSSSISGNLRGLKTELQQVNTSITSLAERLETVETSLATVVRKIDSVETSLNDGHKTVKEDLEKSIATVVQKIDSVETSLNDGHKTVKEDLLSLKQAQDLVTTKIEQSTTEVKDDIYRSKREIFAVTEKEAHIARDRIEGPLPSLGKYSFDFYVENFKTLVRSGKEVHSPPWHINEEKTIREGCVWFKADGKIIVGFNHDRDYRQVGLQPRPARRFEVKATICGGNNKILPDIVVGEETRDMDETVFSHNFGWDLLLGVTSGDDLINKEYGRKEEYGRGAILIRYDVTVL